MADDSEKDVIRKVKEKDVKEDIKEDGADVFAESSTQEVENLLVNPELLVEEEKLQEKAEEENRRFVEEAENENADLTEDQRFEKLHRLLKESKLYSDFLLEKMKKSEEKREADKGKNNDKKNADKKRKRASTDKEVMNPAKKGKRSERTFNGQPIPEDQPTLISGGIMRGYQIEGLQWMLNLDQNGINGILADEMGLGKTIQTISLFAHLIELGVRGPFLIIAPLSTVPNWVKEVKKFAPKLPVILYHGSAPDRKVLRQQHLKEVHTIEDVFAKPRHVKNIFVTSYEIAINDRTYLRSTQWRYIVVDEGHRLKNSNCRLVQELKLYSSANRLLLTGTPLQNNLDELWSLLNFLMPEIFDDVRVFRSWFDAKNLDEGSADEKQRIIAQERQGNILSILHQVLTPFLLRRVKADVDLNIPPKKELLVYCPMTEIQKELYSATVNRTIADLVKSSDDNKKEEPEEEEVVEDSKTQRPKRSNANFDYKAILDLETGTSGVQSEDKYFALLEKLEETRRLRTELPTAYHCKLNSAEVRVSLKTRMMDLRKCCNHPYLLEYPLLADGIHYRIDQEVIEKSGKLKALDQLLTALLDRGHKVLIFSQMTRMLDILGDYLSLKNLNYSRLDGTMGFEDRQENIDFFNETDQTNVFLLSTRAGGLGINLTSADTCIIFDSDWNPQCDLQAQDRCHRIGQTRPVIVYRLVTANTIDEKIVERAAAKRMLEKMVIHRKKFKSQDRKGLTTTMESISPQELLELLNSKDHAGIFDHDSESGQVFSPGQIEKLLDRSDLTRYQDDKENVQANQVKTKSRGRGKGRGKGKATKVDTSTSEVFKVIDTEGCSSSSMLQSVKK